jgi:hypothetical protein
MEQIISTRVEPVALDDIDYEIKSAASSDTEQTHNLLSKTEVVVPAKPVSTEHVLINE